MAEVNEFQQQADNERKRVQSEQLEAIFTIVKDLQVQIKSLKKDNRTIREELRNLDKLRPLRSVKEEEAEEAGEEATDQK